MKKKPNKPTSEGPPIDLDRWKVFLSRLKDALLAVPVRGAARKARLHAALERAWPRIEKDTARQTTAVKKMPLPGKKDVGLYAFLRNL